MIVVRTFRRSWWGPAAAVVAGFSLASGASSAIAAPHPQAATAAGQAAAATSTTQSTTARPAATPQPRPFGKRVAVDPAIVDVDDGDTADIRWSKDDTETIRILGIDTPETRHLPHNIPYDQPFGLEARAFAAGAFAAAGRVELLRSATLDPYGRTLGYLFVNGVNYSVLVVRARLAYESVSHYGDNGLPAEAAEVLKAAKEAGPLPFEPPHVYRARMRDVTEWMKERGLYPEE